MTAKLLPYWFYLAGSTCFLIGTFIAIIREVAR